MSRNTKKQPKTNLQLMTKDSTEERIVIKADCGNQTAPLEKEDANKPLYLKRV